MKKILIKVPDFIRYMSEWREYVLPSGHCIVDKGVTGCGYTEYCLRNSQNIVLCSPRKLLLENKSEQHLKDKNILYIKNDIKDFQGSKSFEERVRDHILDCSKPTIFGGKPGPCKLLVTYDSAFRVAKVLREMGLLDKFYFVVDEFQVIFLDSYFKSSVELDFVEALQGCPNVLYLSATPMLDKYLEKLEEFKSLPYYELDWSETGVVEKIIIKRKFTKSLSGECEKVIQEYLIGKFEVAFSKDKSLVVSKEAVFYFNSISDIIRVINKSNLLPSQVNIICADTKENKAKLSKLTNDLLKKNINLAGEKFVIGKIPLKGETNKMFTFCTKTAYIGSDFHSNNARSFVFADPNISCLALDISLDLPQIAGRQRDDDNPFKNDITIFYRTTRGSNLKDKAEFEKLQEERRIRTLDLLNAYQSVTDSQKSALISKFKSDIRISQYSDDFLSISKHTNLPVYNTLIEVSNQRAWEVSQEDYQDKINVTRALEEVTRDISEYYDEYERIAQDFLDNHFYSTGLFSEKMRMYCEFMDKYSGCKEIEDIIYYKIKDDKFRKYYNYYGTKGCKSREYIEKYLQEGMIDSTKDSELRNAVYNRFKIGNSYTLKEIKEELGVIYRDLGITSLKPKATDLGKYFTLIRVKFTDPQTKKRIEGFRLEPLPPTKTP